MKNITDVLNDDILNKLIGKSIKIKPIRTANGKQKNGHTICKFVSYVGKYAEVVPKGHCRVEKVPVKNIVIWKKGLSLGGMSSEEIEEIMNSIENQDPIDPIDPIDQYPIDPIDQIDQDTGEDIKIRKRRNSKPVKDAGNFVIFNEYLGYYMRLGRGHCWVKNAIDSTSYKNPIIAKRVIGMKSNYDSNFENCTIIELNDVKQSPNKFQKLKAFEKPSHELAEGLNALVGPTTVHDNLHKSEEKNYCLNQLEELFGLRKQARQVYEQAELSLIESKRKLEEIEIDIEAAMKLNNEMK